MFHLNAYFSGKAIFIKANRGRGKCVDVAGFPFTQADTAQFKYKQKHYMYSLRKKEKGLLLEFL
jgi:hypothetical protein